jgi:hypothetical protein
MLSFKDYFSRSSFWDTVISSLPERLIEADVGSNVLGVFRSGGVRQAESSTDATMPWTKAFGERIDLPLDISLIIRPRGSVSSVVGVAIKPSAEYVSPAVGCV